MEPWIAVDAHKMEVWRLKMEPRAQRQDPSVLARAWSKLGLVTFQAKQK
jgi:hypothetical protein